MFCDINHKIEKIFDDFYGYVYTIVKNDVNKYITNEDIEEIISDVFIALWKNKENLNTADQQCVFQNVPKCRGFKKHLKIFQSYKSIFPDNFIVIKGKFHTNDRRHSENNKVN